MMAGPGDLLELQEDKQLALLVKDWDFQQGKTLKLASMQGSVVHHPSSSPHGAFHLLAVFCRYTFWLLESSVSLALHAVLGGSLLDFMLLALRIAISGFWWYPNWWDFQSVSLNTLFSSISTFISIFREIVVQSGLRSGTNGV
jgi:hypothetical protein